MPTDYEKVYQQQRHALGEPAKEFVAFFDQYEKQNASVLDVGCGQGRDALFIARRGHRVTGVDISETGIAQLLEDARREGLQVEGRVADLRDYDPQEAYDVVVIDRTLHMLAPDTRLKLLQRLIQATRDGGYLLIADQKSNLPDMKETLENDGDHWTILKQTRGFLFVRKDR
jgi:2-polyprenyl-3-methyl-5-hydroxy-6-metoxy-1,4-benzoquinol methylase